MRFLAALAAAALLGPAAATAGTHEAKTAAGQDIVAVARSAGSFDTLLAALDAAGLTETLEGPGPFTVFAPTDEAFARIPKAELDALLADKAKLAKVLSYHVVPGRVMAADVTKLSSARTVEGSSLAIDTSNGQSDRPANASARSGSASSRTTRRNCLTKESAWRWVSPCTPQPTRASVRAFGRAR